ncbi:Response regulator MprA [Gemmata obscuriglobus]|uniref:Response regulator n=1 Tax=Gemmata obscuriglobus TaxID=114 RepID=A0A2Z3GZS9_9BACT|nr:response regulator [Gemmata obscuriglobus]AWM39273.1 response regulator [Gemmata obscuriglobus]QEG27666.1 Response regulator MprA [Gemmata obscuriglobus]VTS04855.1 histidine kinase : PAS domain S-box protein OS=Massilia timonae CCUG 45783 GN=HMPREF9710_02278 PE=4 SV=1: Response_reg [Gemmata obscuriglobus UQM 2246]
MTTPTSTPSDVLPALTEKTAGAALPPPPGLRVLCVDDNVDAADSLGAILEMVGCKALVAHDAASALAQVEQFKPQVCVLDISMPEIDGCELARRLRELPGSEEQLFIALTALGDYSSLERMAEAGFDLHFTKPLPPAELYEVLNRYAEKGRPGM